MRRLLVLALSLLSVPFAGAEPPGRVARRVDLGAHRVPPRVLGPLLSIPFDVASDHPGWASLQAEVPRPWQAFDEPTFAESAFALDALRDLVEMTHRSLWESDGASLDLDRGHVVVAGEPDAVQRVEASAKAWARALDPTVRVDAVLLGDEGEERVLAMGGAVLHPGRWTRLWAAEHATPVTVDWDIELAEEATTMNPIVIDAVEGQELYLRWHPGESVGLVEVWAGLLDLTEVRELDVSEVRNVPEANAPGLLSLPQSAVKRAYVPFLLPVGEAATREVRWSGPGGPARLTMRFAASIAGEAPKGEGGLARVLRVGAVAASLHGDVRRSGSEALRDRIIALGADQEFDLHTLSEDVHVARGPAAFVDAARALVIREEAALTAAIVEVRCVLVPADAVRGPLTSGALTIGGIVEGPVLDAFRAAGASTPYQVAVPLVGGLRAGMRVGEVATGLLDFDSEVAQQSAGLDPVTIARFGGLAGSVSLERTTTGWRLGLEAWLSWVQRDASKIGLVFRPPVSMATGTHGLQDEPDFRRRVTLPVLGGGQTRLDVTADVLVGASGASPVVLLAALPRGAEVLLVVASVRP